MKMKYEITTGNKTVITLVSRLYLGSVRALF